MAHRKMTPAERFFYYHAGFSYDPQTETKAQGKRRCATQMAEAEAYAQDAGWTFNWADDFGVNHDREFGYTPQTCESCLLSDRDDHHLAGLGCIDDASADYRRVIEAELASEAYAEIRDKQRNDTEVYSYCAL